MFMGSDVELEFWASQLVLLFALKSGVVELFEYPRAYLRLS